MSAPSIRSMLRDTWYLLVLLAVIAAAAVFMYLRERSTPPPVAPPVAKPAAPTEQTPAEQSAPAQDPNEAMRARTSATIAEYQKRLDDDPKSPEAPALLNAMANLSRQKLLDYKEAARYYELIITDYPNWEQTAKIYPQLATCYERLNDQHNLQWVYKQMMERFPQDSQEYLYAKQQLGLQ